MKIQKNLAAFAILLIATLSACKKDDQKPAGEFASGVVVINEGSFNSSDGSLSFYNTSSGAVTQDIFGLKNNGKALGDVVQSMTVEGDLAFIVVNNSNKLEVTNANTMVSQYTISGLSLPRYFTTLNGKGYLTEWINFSDSGRVAVINLTSQTVETAFAIGYGPENIIALNGKLYISNNFSNAITVIDPLHNKVLTNVTVGSAPGAFVVDKNNKLWVICGGGYDSDFNPINDGALYKINPVTNSVETSIPLSKNLVPKLTISKAKDKLFYFDTQHVYQVDIAAASGPSSAFITEAAVINFYGIGVDPSTDILYAGDSKAFAGNGRVYRYKNDGTKIDNFEAGRGPNGFVFR